MSKEAGAAVSLASMSDITAILEKEKVIAELEYETCTQKDPMSKILSKFLPHVNNGEVPLGNGHLASPLGGTLLPPGQPQIID